MHTLETNQQAHSLCQSLVASLVDSKLCTITPAIYDTAWLSMVFRRSVKNGEWVFPECFQYVKDHQRENGGWEGTASSEDAILNSLAALLALRRHQTSMNTDNMLQESINKAIRFLDSALQELGIDENLAVGFEYLVPALLGMLQAEGIRFSFPAEGALLALNDIKLKKFTPELLYSTEETTMLHSLEAFTDKVDFNKLRHRKLFGSMMASPASTAAYLIQLDTWDEEAENYLRGVIHEGPGKGSGAVPSVYPTPLFEVSWVNLLL